MKRETKSATHLSLSAEQGRRLLAHLGRHRHQLSPLLILTHDFPDPDALAAAFALQHLAQSVFGIPTRIAYGQDGTWIPHPTYAIQAAP